MSDKGRLAATFLVVLVSLSGCGHFGGSSPSSSLSKSNAASDSEAMIRVAQALVDSGEYSQALPILRVLDSRGAAGVDVLVMMGESLSGLGAYLEAIKVYDQAFAKQPENPRVARGMGYARMGLKRPDLALPHFEKAYETMPDDPDVMNGLALSKVGVGIYDEALTLFQEGAYRHPGHKRIRSNYGLSLALLGDHEGAIDVLEPMVLNDEATSRDRQNLALAYGLAGDNETAKKLSHIDLAPQSVKSNVTFFNELAAMSPRMRISVLIGASPNQGQTTRHLANDAFPTKDAETEKLAQLASARVLVDEEPVIIVEEIIEELEEIEPAIGVDESIEALDDGTLVPVLLGAEGYALQIAAYRSAGELLPGWKILSEEYADLIGDLPPRRSEVDYGDREGDPTGFYYRLNAGPLFEADRAADICKKIKNLGGDCWVRPPEKVEAEQPAAMLLEGAEPAPEASIAEPTTSVADVTPATDLAPIVEPASSASNEPVVADPTSEPTADVSEPDLPADETAVEAAPVEETPDEGSNRAIWSPIPEDFDGTGESLIAPQSGAPQVIIDGDVIGMPTGKPDQPMTATSIPAQGDFDPASDLAADIEPIVDLEAGGEVEADPVSGAELDAPLDAIPLSD